MANFTTCPYNKSVIYSYFSHSYLLCLKLKVKNDIHLTQVCLRSVNLTNTLGNFVLLIDLKLDNSCAWRVIRALNTAIFTLHGHDFDDSFKSPSDLTATRAAFAANLPTRFRGRFFFAILSGGCRGKSTCAWL